MGHYFYRHPDPLLVFHQDRRLLDAVIKGVFIEWIFGMRIKTRPPGGDLIPTQGIHMAGGTIKIFMDPPGMRRRNFGVAVLAIGLSLHITHPFLTRSMAVYAMDIIFIMHIRRHPRRDCVISPHIRLASPALHGARMTLAAAAESAATFGFGCFAEPVGLIPMGGKVTIETAGMAGIADSLFVLGLFLGERNIKVLTNFFGILTIKTGRCQNLLRREGGKRRAAVVRAVGIHPRFHGALTKIGGHQGGVELL